MFRKVNRILAFILAFALVVTTFGSDFATLRTYAEDAEAALFEATEEPAQEDASEESEDADEAEEEESEEEVQDAEEVSSEDEGPAEDEEQADPEAEESEETEEAVDPEAEEPAEPAESAEDAEKEEPKDEKPEGAITVTYTALEGGSVSLAEEVVDITAEEVVFKGSTATADEGYIFTGWTDKDGNPVFEEETYVPSELTEDAEFIAAFEAEAEEEEEEEEEEVDMPAVNFLKSTGTITVSVSADEGAFPEGTEMKVSDVNDSEVLSTAENAVDGQAKAVSAVDISFYYKGKEIEPAKAINVKLYHDDIAEAEGIEVVHIDDKGEADVMGSDVKGDTVTFESDAFSIYVIVETGDDARLFVEFKNGDTQIAEMIVKLKDTEDEDNYAAVLYDPGAGEVPAGMTFTGWTTDKDYTLESESFTIDEIRTNVKAMLPPYADGEKITYYAMFTHGYTVNYLDENNVSLGKEIVELPATATGDELKVQYEVNMVYTPKDDVHNFQGWLVYKGSENIEGYEKDKCYANETVITITGDVTFSVNAPEGNWLVFNENGNGATYIPPQFVETGKNTKDPEIEMKRYGYKFLGWYLNAEGTGEPFEFGHTIEEKTTIFAKWEANPTAPYTVIINTQNLSRSGYDIKASYVYENGTVGQNIPWEFANNGDEDYAYIGTGAKRQKIQFTGFCLQENVKDAKITPEGDAVLNLYFDRIEYKFKFYYYREPGDSNYAYSFPYNSGSGSDYNNLVTWHNESSHPTVDYTDYSESIGVRTYHYFVMEAYYGENIESKWPSYDKIHGVNVHDNGGGEPVSFVMMVGTKLKPNPTNDGSGTVKGVITTLDENILGKTNDKDGNYVFVRFAKKNEWRYHIWFETVPGEDYSGKTIRTLDGKSYYEDHVVVSRSSNVNVDEQNPPSFQGYNCDPSAIQRRDRDWKTRNKWTTNNETVHHINYIYDRLGYIISYKDGEYIDPEGNHIQNRNDRLLHATPSINQGATIVDEYKNYVPTLPASEAGYVFEGWYSDSACTEKYTFTKMPIGGITVYAKWRKVQYRVFLHPNAGTSVTDPSLDWGGAAMSYRVDYGATIKVPYGLRDGYEFVGWYTDSGFGKVFNEDTILNDTTVTESYDKTTHMTDPMDKWGNGAKTNDDLDRPWLTKEFNLYAKWRKVIDGALGINVIYDLHDPVANVDGTGTAVDNNIYVDGAMVSAVPAVKSAKEGYSFDSWMLQKWDGNKYVDVKKVYPGQKFELDIDDAKVTPRDDGSKAYTIQLRASFKKNGEPTPTFIPWFVNDGTAAYHVDTVASPEQYNDSNLGINKAVAIQKKPERSGFKFLGWARIDMGRSKEAADSFMTTKANWTQENAAQYMFLYYNETNGKFYSDAALTKEAKQVAADERMPYQAMFAVWEQVTYTYTVHYYLEGATTVVKVFDDLEVSGNEYGTTVDVDAKDATSKGYKLSSSTDQYGENESGRSKVTVSFEGTAKDVEITFFYVPRTDLTYTVYYLEQGTEKPLADPDTVEGQTFDTKVTVIPDADKDAEIRKNYDPVPPTSQEITIKVSGNDVKFYYKPRTDFTYTVHYYKNGTTESVPGLTDETRTGKTYGETYKETAKTKEGWDIVGDSEKEFVLDENGKQIIFYYEPVSGLSYTVYYLEQGTEKPLANPDEVGGKTYGETITVSPNAQKHEQIQEFYTLVSPKTQDITIELKDNSVTFYYTKRVDFDYTVHYYQKGTSTPVPGLTDETRYNKTYNQTYKEDAKDATASGWEVDGAASQEFVLDVNHKQITFYYVPRSDLSYTVRYLEEKTGKVLADPDEVGKQTYGATVTVTPDEQKNNEITKKYKLVSAASQNLTIELTGNEVVFEYAARTDYTYVVHYYKKNTTETVPGLSDKTESGKTYGQSYTEEAKDATASGWVVDGASKQTFTLEENGQEIIFYYVEREDLSYTVQYLDVDTKQSVFDEKKVNNVKLGSKHTEKYEEVSGYYLDESSQEKQTIEISANEDENVLIFYYKIRSDLGYTVHYYEENTTNPVSPDKLVENKTYKQEITEEAVKVEGWNALAPTSQDIVVDVDMDDVIFYYAKRNDLQYTVHYYEENTTKPVIPDKVVKNQVYQTLVTESPVEVANYFIIDDAEQGITIDVDPDKNVIIFYYGKMMNITLHAIGGTTDYSAEEHSVEGFTVTYDDEQEGGLVSKATGFLNDLFGTVAEAKDVSDKTGDNTVVINGKTYTVEGITSGAKATDAGRTPTQFAGRAQVTLDGEDVTNRFNVKTEDAELVINKRPITFTSATDSKVYNGIPLTNHEVTVSGSGFAGNDNASFNVTGTRTNPGWSYNTFTYTFTSGKESNYDVTVVEGRLTVTGGGGDDPTPDPPTPTPIPDDPTPVAPAPTPSVLGAQREEPKEQAAVLGARRGRTADSSNPAASVLAILVSAACALSILLLGKKKEEDET